MATERYICIHGHFYQPPRENPWLERIELQESAHPFHDWNERIDRECYAPNAAARILDHEERIVRIVNNYASISFNFGPTLLGWLETHDPATYAAILEADRRGAERCSGHGSAIAQAYGHAILPLCNARDRRTQVLWGIRDFERRFGRAPEGMWLPETAVDTETLEVLAACGIRFTILAPSQAAAWREIGSEPWTEVGAAGIDTHRAYRANLPSGAAIAIFFYDGPISRGVAFERLLARGDRFAARLLAGFDERREGPQLVHIATDGETYGHHHKFGEMALAWAVDSVERDPRVRLTNYGEFLERHPPRHEVRIRERTAWSCAHGLGRWSADCGCSIGTHPEWKQAWRAPLRQALDLLRDAWASPFEREARRLLSDPWAARDAYVDCLPEPGDAETERFLHAHAAHPLGPEERTRALALLELQRHALLMYTSCGWFFDDISGIEAQQVLQYAARGLELAESLFGSAAEREPFLHVLAGARSNHPEEGDGRALFERRVEPRAATPARIVASFAGRLLFDGDPAAAFAPGVDVHIEERLQFAWESRGRADAGKLSLELRRTAERTRLMYAAVHPGDHTLLVGVRPFIGDAAYRALLADLRALAGRADRDAIVSLLNLHFPDAIWSLAGLLPDEQQQVLGCILEATLGELESVYRKLLDHHAPLRRIVAGLGSAQPLELRLPGELVVNKDLRRALAAGEPDAAALGALVKRAAAEGLDLDGTTLGLAASRALAAAIQRLAAAPADVDRLVRTAALATTITSFPFPVDLHAAQNALWRLRGETYASRREAAERGDTTAQRWVRAFGGLAATLRVAMS